MCFVIITYSGGARVGPDGAMAPSVYGLAPPGGGASYSLAIKYHPAFVIFSNIIVQFK